MSAILLSEICVLEAGKPEHGRLFRLERYAEGAGY